MTKNPKPTALSAEAVLHAAELETGHRGLMDAGFVQRLIRLVGWINERGPYGEARLDAMRRQVQLVVATRLRIEGDRRRIAAIADEVVERPVFVVGFPRSGTTLLHSLLAEDPAVHVPRVWHCLSPSPPPGEGPVCRGRYDYADRKLQQLLDTAPGLLTLHPYWDKYSQALVEDEELFTLDLRNAYPTWFHQVSTLSVLVEIGGDDAAETYGFHQRLLQHLQWNTGKRRWAVKGVGHQFLLDPLLARYPDAICIWPHRDPIEILASMFSIAVVLYEGISPGGNDWRKFAHDVVESTSAGLVHVMNSAVINDPRVIHLGFRDIVREPVEAIRRVYERTGLPFTEDFAARMRAWLADPENSSDRYGRYDYAYQPFGIDPEWVNGKFAAYRQRFCST